MGVAEGCQEWCKKLWRVEEEKNKRVVDSFTLQHPILDYISDSCFLCVFLRPGPEKKAAKISFNLPQKLKQGSLKAPCSQISEAK